MWRDESAVSGMSPTPFGWRNFMKNGSGLKCIFNDLGTFFDRAHITSIEAWPNPRSTLFQSLPRPIPPNQCDQGHYMDYRWTPRPRVHRTAPAGKTVERRSVLCPRYWPPGAPSLLLA